MEAQQPIEAEPDRAPHRRAREQGSDDGPSRPIARPRVVLVASFGRGCHERAIVVSGLPGGQKLAMGVSPGHGHFFFPGPGPVTELVKIFTKSGRSGNSCPEQGTTGGALPAPSWG